MALEKLQRFISMLEKTQFVSFGWSGNSGAIDDKKERSVLEKNPFKLLGLSFSS